MPLRNGNSNEVISQNIKELLRSGKSKNQAIAIALKKAGKTKSRKAHQIVSAKAESTFNPESFIRSLVQYVAGYTKLASLTSWSQHDLNKLRTYTNALKMIRQNNYDDIPAGARFLISQSVILSKHSHSIIVKYGGKSRLGDVKRDLDQVVKNLSEVRV